MALPYCSLEDLNLSGDFRTLLASEVEHDVGLGDTPNQSARAEVINNRKSLSVNLQEFFESCSHTLVWRYPREICIQQIRRNHHPGEFRSIEKLFDVV